MTTVERSAEIDAGVEQVWAVLADFARISDWAPDVDHSCLMSDRTSGAGIVRRVQVGTLVLVETVTTWNPPTQLAYEIVGLPPIVEVSNSWTLAANGHRTTATLTTSVEGGNRPAHRLIARAVASRMAKASEAMLTGLAAHVADHVTDHVDDRIPEPAG